MAAGTDSKILSKLEEQKRKEGTLPRLLEFYQGLLRIQSKAEQRIDASKPSLNSETINSRLESGLSLVSFDELTSDWALLPDIFAEALSPFAEYSELFGEIPKSLRESKPSQSLLNKTAKGVL